MEQTRLATRNRARKSASSSSEYKTPFLTPRNAPNQPTHIQDRARPCDDWQVINEYAFTGCCTCFNHEIVSFHRRRVPHRMRGAIVGGQYGSRGDCSGTS